MTLARLTTPSALLLALVATAVAAKDPVPPPGWNASSTPKDVYVVTLDTVMRHGGKASAYLEGRRERMPRPLTMGPQPRGTGSPNEQRDRGPDMHGTISQSVRAADYRGKRVKVTGWIRTDDAMKVLPMLRAEGMHEGEYHSLVVSNMQGKGLVGFNIWQVFTHVMDVPANAEVLTVGVQMLGPGKAWLDDLAMELVDSTVATTSSAAPPVDLKLSGKKLKEMQARWPQMAATLRNADFEEPATATP